VYPSLSRAGDNLEIHFIDVGQGDCTLINLPDGETMLVDTGSPAAGLTLIKYLRSIDINHIDHLIFTHPHDDHIGGIFNLLSEIKVTRFYDNGFSNFNSTIYGDYITLVRNDLSKYIILQNGESLELGDVTISILNPILPPTGNTNDDSIVLKLSYGDINVLLTGDMGRLRESRILKANMDLKSRIIKVSHHGDNDASTSDFLKGVNPETAIISVATYSKYARPGKAVLDRLRKKGAKIYRTDIHGSIKIVTNGKTYSVHTEKADQGR
jgi:beta-lactamase superfamily II metal-dependent hydrolase